MSLRPGSRDCATYGSNVGSFLPETGWGEFPIPRVETLGYVSVAPLGALPGSRYRPPGLYSKRTGKLVPSEVEGSACPYPQPRRGDT